MIPENLFKYAKFYVKILRKGKLVGDPTILRSNMVLCTPEMFEALGEGDNLSVEKLNKRLCPDMDTIKEVLRVKNSYSDKDERVSFSLQAVACDQSLDTCASTADIEEFFKEVYFTTYILKENIAFGDNSNIMKRPVSVTDQFHSQFALKPDEYRDCNTYIKFNKVITNDDIWAMTGK